MFKPALKMAWASVTRRRTRSVLLILMISLSLWGLLFMEGFYEGMYEQLISNAIRSDSGHLSLFGKGYRLDPDLANWIKDDTELNDFLVRDLRVKSYVKRLQQDGLVATAHYSRGTSILGVDLTAEERHGHLAGYLYKGEYTFGNR